MKRIAALLMAALVVSGLAGCGGKTEESIQVIAMDTMMGVTAYGKNASDAVQDAEKEIFRLEDLLSRTDPESIVSQLNAAEGTSITVGEEVCSLMKAAEAYSQATDGAFDITIAPVVSAWGFTTDSYQVPDQAELAELLKLVGAEHMTITGDTATLTPGTQIDLGGIAKGYASDRMEDIFEEYQVSRGKVELGGNILLIGDKPDGTAWRVGIQDPARPNEQAYAAIVQLTDAFAVTSGSYQRYFEMDGQTYHHIIDPSTGYPADSGLTSVTVVADRDSGSGTMCDALSTAVFVMGEEKALEFWRSGVYDFELVLVTEDDRVVVTKGLEEKLVEIEESGYTYEIVS